MRKVAKKVCKLSLFSQLSAPIKSGVRKKRRCYRYDTFFSHFDFPASGQAVVSGVVSSPPRYVPSVLPRIGFSIPTACRFSSNVANSRSRAFRESIRAQEKVSANLYECVFLTLSRSCYSSSTTRYALGGTRTHVIDLQ